MAEGLLRDMAKQRGLDLVTDSAGTGDHHVGQPPDPRAQREMKRRGHDISDLRARQFTSDDFHRFDLLIAMDGSNLRNMLRKAPNDAAAAKAKLMLDWSTTHPGAEVPDPWFGGPEGFTEVFHLLEDSLGQLLNELDA